MTWSPPFKIISQHHNQVSEAVTRTGYRVVLGKGRLNLPNSPLNRRSLFDRAVPALGPGLALLVNDRVVDRDHLAYFFRAEWHRCGQLG